MLAYERGEGCRMELLQRELDDPTAAPCGRCDVCAGPWYPVDATPEAVAAATGALDRVGVPIEPRGQWPTGAGRLGVEADGRPVSGKIAADERPETGRVVARLTDLGWGGVLRELFGAGAPDAPVSDDLLGGCVRVLSDWTWAERPVGVVVMPSVARPQLVGSVAEGIARLGRLPLLGQLELADGAPADTAGGNSAYRLAGVWGRFLVGPDLAAALSEADGPVLLVDDLVDSRWTMTVAARELRLHGADSVLPFALASVA